MKGSVTYQAILREGREEGALAEARRMLLLAGAEHLGAPDAASRAALERIQDVERLEKLITRVFRAADWRKLLEQPAPRRRNGPRRRPS
jgi:hypothetical protein